MKLGQLSVNSLKTKSADMSSNFTTVLVCNAGSTSLKLTLYQGSKQMLDTIQLTGDSKQLSSGYSIFLTQHDSSMVVLHRIVHSGAVDEKPKRIDQQLKATIRHWQHLAPLHNNLALKLIKLTENLWPKAKQYALFDSGLFYDLPSNSQNYAIPPLLSPLWPIRRYGFHGLAHRHQWNILQKTKRFTTTVTLQLGGGCSATAWKNRQVMDTTMGFSPLDGLVMSTRCGAIDPSILLHLIQHEEYSADQLYKLLNQQSGLKGLSGKSEFMPLLLQDKGAEAELAVDHFCYQIQKTIGAFYVVLGGIDAISFGGGIGENQAIIREKIMAPLSSLSMQMNKSKNHNAGQGHQPLQTDGSATEIWKIQVDESKEMLNQYQTFTNKQKKYAQ